jgi:hypothetical protein
MANIYQIRLAADSTPDFNNKQSRLNPAPMYALAYPPFEFKVGGIAPQYAEIPRPGNSPLTDFASHSLVEISFSFVVGYNDMSSIESDLNILRALANPPDRSVYRRSPIQFFGFPQILNLYFNTPGVRSSPFWRITNMDVSIESRKTSDPAGGGILIPTRATIDMTCKQDNPSFLQSIVIPSATYKPPTKVVAPAAADNVTNKVQFGITGGPDQGVTSINLGNNQDQPNGGKGYVDIDPLTGLPR